MKAILEFDLEDSADNKLHKRAISATEAYINLYNIYEYLMNQDVIEAIPEKNRKELFELINDNGVSFMDLD